jgi:hypothetical protein
MRTACGRAFSGLLDEHNEDREVVHLRLPFTLCGDQGRVYIGRISRLGLRDSFCGGIEIFQNASSEELATFSNRGRQRPFTLGFAGAPPRNAQ